MYIAFAFAPPGWRPSMPQVADRAPQLVAVHAAADVARKPWAIAIGSAAPTAHAAARLRTPRGAPLV